MARSGPRPQFMPTMSAPAARRLLATSAGLSPHMVRSRSCSSSYWKNMVAITGRSGHRLAGADRGDGLLREHHGLHREEVDAALGQGLGLLAERLEVLLVGGVAAELVVDRQAAGRADRARHVAAGRAHGPRQPRALVVELARAVAESVLVQLERGCPRRCWSRRGRSPRRSSPGGCPATTSACVSFQSSGQRR